MLLFFQLAFASEFYGVDTDKITNLKHKTFQSHQTGWSGIGSDGLTRIYIAPSEEAAERWTETMKKRHYKSKFEETEEFGSPAFFDGNDVLIIRFGLILVLLQGENITERLDTIRNALVIEQSTIPNVPIIQTNANLFSIQITEDWKFHFQGGKPNYQQPELGFDELPTELTVFNSFCQSHQFLLVTTEQENLPIQYYQLKTETMNNDILNTSLK